MKIHTSLTLFVLLLAGINCQGSSTTDTTQTVPDTTTASADTTTVADTTTMADTTTASDTTTKVPTTTVSPATTTTAQSPTTTTQSPNTTTPKPTVAPTTPVPPTTEPPVAELGSWNVTEGNTTCIRADLKIRFMIPVNGREDYIALSPNATAKGSCNGFNDTQELRLTDLDSKYTLTFTFEKDDKEAYLKNVSLNFVLPGDTGIAYNDSKLFKVSIGNSYLCSNTETVPLLNVSMEIFQIHLQAYGSAGNENFGTAEECEADDKVNDLVPIAVGCALLALVVIVLIAYFVGRRRSRQKGYQSV